MAKGTATGPAAPRGALSWDKFEEHAKVAFVENAAGSCFFFRTSTSGPAQLRVVARVSTHRKTAAELTHHTSTFKSASRDSLARVTRLLRFAMQEVLGPMRAQGVTSPRLARALLPSLGPLSPTNASATASAASGGAAAGNADKKKKKKKTKK